jgi:hypothetical protein
VIQQQKHLQGNLQQGGAMYILLSLDLSQQKVGGKRKKKTAFL